MRSKTWPKQATVLAFYREVSVSILQRGLFWFLQALVRIFLFCFGKFNIACTLFPETTFVFEKYLVTFYFSESK